MCIGGIKMKIPKRNFPPKYFQKSLNVSSKFDALPFYIKEFGYSDDRKLLLGQSNNYSDYLLFYPVTGVTRFVKNNETQFLQPDNVVVSACNTPLSFTRSSKHGTFIYLIVGGSHAKYFYNVVRTKSSVIRCTPMHKILDLFLDVIGLDYNNAFYSNMQASFLIHNIFLDLYNISYNVMRAKTTTPIHETVVNQCLKYIENNYKNYLNVDIICEEVSFSKDYFCKLFKEYTGVTLHQYICEYRVNKSKDLLTHSKLSIGAIAAAVGFENPLTYSRCFERYAHMTPTEYRKNF